MTGLPPAEDGAPLGLLTDLYELRMAQTYLLEGMTAPATFTLYIRPDARRPWWLAAGTGSAIEVLDRFRYDAAEIDYLAKNLDLSDDFLGWLAELEPHGELWAVDDGTVVLGDEPFLEITASLPFAQLLETALLS
ncbi:MAG: nicotinate phosphoribosyltransferase, partial [Nitriliruptorales bacterium]